MIPTLSVPALHAAPAPVHRQPLIPPLPFPPQIAAAHPLTTYVAASETLKTSPSHQNLTHHKAAPA